MRPSFGQKYSPVMLVRMISLRPASRLAIYTMAVCKKLTFCPVHAPCC